MPHRDALPGPITALQTLATAKVAIPWTFFRQIGIAMSLMSPPLDGELADF